VTAAAGLDAELSLDLGRFALEHVQLAVGVGETVALVGPNGAGKTTVLRALAGLTRIDAGHVVLDGVSLDDPGSGAFVPAERRAVGVVFQDLLLFPHLSALDNVAFGPRSRGASRSEARGRAHELLDLLDLSELAGERPRALSGGQAQRVAVARALAVEPRLLLLDEPLAALDATTRPSVRRELATHLADYGGARVLVTHDPLEAITLADRLVVLEDGRCTQVGTPAEVRERPRSRYVADFVGLNLYRGTAGPAGLVVDDTGALLVTADQHVRGAAFAVVHPRTVALHRAQPEGTPRNVWAGTVRHIDPEGDRARVHIDAAVPITAEITDAALRALALDEGAAVWATVKATEVDVYAA
jgi:molybdate transport system ATP-binding protein